MSEADMYGCENGHTFCRDYFVGDIEEAEKEYDKRMSIENIASDILRKESNVYFFNLSKEEQKPYLEKAEKIYDLEKYDEDDLCLDDFEYSIPAKNCPICSLTYINDSTVLRYLLKENNTTKKDVEDIIRDKFEDLEEFNNEN